MESNYGIQPGDKNVIRSLGTLIVPAPRPNSPSRSSIIGAENPAARRHCLEAMNGSWAGAMGHTQFIPTTYTRYAVDHDGDGKRDIWTDIPDALGSTASYSKSRTGCLARPGVTRSVCPRVSIQTSEHEYDEDVGDWQRLGIVRVNGEPFPRPSDKATFFAPAGRMAHPSSCSIIFARSSTTTWRSPMRWPSAISPTGLRGSGPFVHPWPTDETHLSLDQRKQGTNRTEGAPT